MKIDNIIIKYNILNIDKYNPIRLFLFCSNTLFAFDILIFFISKLIKIANNVAVIVQYVTYSPVKIVIIIIAINIEYIYLFLACFFSVIVSNNKIIRSLFFKIQDILMSLYGIALFGVYYKAMTLTTFIKKIFYRSMRS